MPRRILRVERLIAVLGILVLVLGAVILWLVTQGGQTDEPTSLQRAQTQLELLTGVKTRILYNEAGKRNAVCGYIKIDGEDVIFVSRPNRLLLSTDPLKTEFEDMLGDLCPGFARLNPPTPPIDTWPAPTA